MKTPHAKFISKKKHLKCENLATTPQLAVRWLRNRNVLGSGRPFPLRLLQGLSSFTPDKCWGGNYKVGPGQQPSKHHSPIQSRPEPKLPKDQK